MHVFKSKCSRQELDLSIIITAGCGKQNTAELWREIENVMSTVSWSWECLWIGDASTKNALPEWHQIVRKNILHHFIILSHNVGQSADTVPDFSYARGRILVLLDGIGQNNPLKDIPERVIRLMEDETAIVKGVGKKQKNFCVRKTASWVANTLRNRISELQRRVIRFWRALLRTRN